MQSTLRRERAVSTDAPADLESLSVEEIARHMRAGRVSLLAAARELERRGLARKGT